MRSREREEKDLGVEAEGEKSEERDPGQGPDIGGTGKNGDDTPVRETEIESDGGERGTTTVAAPRVRMGDIVGEEAVTLIVMRVEGTVELAGQRSLIL